MAIQLLNPQTDILETRVKFYMVRTPNLTSINFPIFSKIQAQSNLKRFFRGKNDSQTSVPLPRNLVYLLLNCIL